MCTYISKRNKSSDVFLYLWTILSAVSLLPKLATADLAQAMNEESCGQLLGEPVSVILFFLYGH
jgi:hypothetical protein